MTKAVIASVLLIMSSACGTSTPAVQGHTPLTLPALAPRHALTRPPDISWMEPAARSKSLLYVSDVYGNVVYVFNYPQLTPAGVLTGFNEPEGLCTDQSGDVWVANTLDSQLVEYAHGSKSPKQVLTDSN